LYDFEGVMVFYVRSLWRKQ